MARADRWPSAHRRLQSQNGTNGDTTRDRRGGATGPRKCDKALCPESPESTEAESDEEEEDEVEERELRDEAEDDLGSIPGASSCLPQEGPRTSWYNAWGPVACRVDSSSVCPASCADHMAAKQTRRVEADVSSRAAGYLTNIGSRGAFQPLAPSGSTPIQSPTSALRSGATEVYPKRLGACGVVNRC